MTSPNLDLPMLYGFSLGEMISCHDGVCCYPARCRGSEEQYILKVISIPASASKLDALLLTGALADEKAAMAYFKKLAQDLLRQAELLRELSHQGGFAAYLDSGMCPMEEGVGYYVCLLGTQKQSLDSVLNSGSLTHADILHMGLDLCAALAASRRAGMLYADLKPGNIFYDMEQGCRIGDVGFIALSSLNYTCLPDKYRSRYTAPELYDDFRVLDSTVDVFSLGMVLYQAYNGGTLPFDGPAPAEELPSPLYADYEMARILAKACHPDPAQRWQDPTQLAQALMGYMQQFGAPETPIVPAAVEAPEEEEEEEEVEEFLPEADPEELQAEMEQLQEDEAVALAFLDELRSDETDPGEDDAAAISEEDLSEELSAMLTQADELISHDLPPVTPEPVEIPAPPEEEESGEEAEPEIEMIPAEDEVPLPAPEDTPDEEAVPTVTEEEAPKKQRSVPKWIPITALLLLVAIGLFFFGRHYYDNVYTLHVQSMVMEHTPGTLAVQVVTDADERLLRVLCSDGDGYSHESALVNGIAQFTNLDPNTRYTVQILTDGKHRVTGHTTDTFTTPEQATILSFTATIGPEDCSVILNFTVDGPDADSWILRYGAEGIGEQTHAFTGRTTTIYGLTDGAEYTFSLESQTQLYMVGTTQVTYRATNILYATNLQITACGEGSLTAQWQQPDNGTVPQWRVRCYNDEGYDVTVTTDQCSYTFTELSHSSPCTVEVTAAGMDRSVSISIPADPITIQNFTCTVTDEMALLVTWDHMGPAPIGGWLIGVSIDGGEVTQLEAEENKLLLMLLPNSQYNFGFIAAPGSLILQDQYSYTASDVSVFAGYDLDAAELESVMCLQPKEDVRDWEEYLRENSRTQFSFDENPAILLQTTDEPEASDDAVNVQFVINSAEGTPLHMDSTALLWSGMWQDGVCCLALPYLPQVPGSYTVILYFDGQFVVSQEFAVA